ncbi:predicted protein [Sclerotinia sclerotiorum 1980 UF-70]|uniref:Uncharacterized protein n=1 Tax=Sclerotinia sclerotiorum (strain ATCC 18683 / 1980 / Ss-1) TaxID=665079 RepID=A7E7T6_SCLS1|nr:predicted protein [Sclerotinia sclerotiorum 1980 UF-70]EDN96438.1 predicted protein [Sclerotinia sclerotiorum 1980 UF-70]
MTPQIYSSRILCRKLRVLPEAFDEKNHWLSEEVLPWWQNFWRENSQRKSSRNMMTRDRFVSRAYGV